jgi:hypothetical protein
MPRRMSSDPVTLRDRSIAAEFVARPIYPELACLSDRAACLIPFRRYLPSGGDFRVEAPHDAMSPPLRLSP